MCHGFPSRVCISSNSFMCVYMSILAVETGGTCMLSMVCFNNYYDDHMQDAWEEVDPDELSYEVKNRLKILDSCT